MASTSSPNRNRKEQDVPRRRKGLELLRIAFTEQNDEWDLEELLDVIYWQRQLVALAAGVAWGVVPLTGLWAFLGFIALNLVVVLSWCRTQRIDEDDYGGLQALLGEGLPPSIGLFLLVWILAYTAIGYPRSL